MFEVGIGGKTFEKPGHNVTPVGALFNWQIAGWIYETGVAPWVHVVNWVGPILPYP